MQPGKDSITLRGKILTSGEATQVISSSSPTPAKGHGTRNEAQRFILSAGPLVSLAVSRQLKQYVLGNGLLGGRGSGCAHQLHVNGDGYVVAKTMDNQ